MEISMTRIPTLIPTLILGIGLLTCGIASTNAAPLASTPPSAAQARPTSTASNDQGAGMDRGGDPYTHALNTLEADGYNGITNFAADSQNFDATAWHDGHQIAVTLDPATGAVHTRG
jgi:hypothetical protein